MSVNTVASEHSGQRVFLKAGGEAHACELRAALPGTLEPGWNGVPTEAGGEPSKRGEKYFALGLWKISPLQDEE